SLSAGAHRALSRSPGVADPRPRLYDRVRRAPLFDPLSVRSRPVQPLPSVSPGLVLLMILVYPSSFDFRYSAFSTGQQYTRRCAWKAPEWSRWGFYPPATQRVHRPPQTDYLHRVPDNTCSAPIFSDRLPSALYPLRE